MSKNNASPPTVTQGIDEQTYLRDLCQLYFSVEQYNPSEIIGVGLTHQHETQGLVYSALYLTEQGIHDQSKPVLDLAERCIFSPQCLSQALGDEQKLEGLTELLPYKPAVLELKSTIWGKRFVLQYFIPDVVDFYPA